MSHKFFHFIDTCLLPLSHNLSQSSLILCWHGRYLPAPASLTHCHLELFEKKKQLGEGEHSGIAAAGAADMGLDAFSSLQSTCWITWICCLLHWHLCSYLVIAHSCLSLMWLINVLKDFSIFDLSSFFSNITTTQI